MIDEVDTVKSARADLADKKYAQFDEEVMTDQQLRDAAAKCLLDSEILLAEALKQQHDPLWHKKQIAEALEEQQRSQESDPTIETSIPNPTIETSIPNPTIETSIPDPSIRTSIKILSLIKELDATQNSLNRNVETMRRKAAVFMSARDVTLKSTFNTSSFAKSDKLSGGVKSVGSYYAHGRFTSHDLAHQMELSGTCMVKGTEPHSTATCATCGKCIRNQGRSKIYHCSNWKCRAKHDRDEGGAKGNAIIKLAGFFYEEKEEEEEVVAVAAAIPNEDDDEVC